ncbi:adenosine deaminase AGSA-like [Culicoides brevitarsis]|uniref:adenosine deaminase AGSA-like n=1 Tax=Culicoides brevitarsis TaxID=469753 RepID=UPI00307BB043
MFIFLIFTIILPQKSFTSLLPTRYPTLIEVQGRPTPLEYDTLRKNFFLEQKNRYLGADLTLSPQEERVNDIIMRLKRQELTYGFSNPGNFSGAVHIFQSFERIDNSSLFKILRKMPKGGVLHAHDTALLSTAKVIEFTYRENLWILGDLDENSDKLPKFLFALSKPQAENGLEWQSVADLRLAKGSEVFDKELHDILSLYSSDSSIENRDINYVWRRFKSIFSVLGGIVCYDEVWKAYFYQALQEFLDDGVQYLEFRGLLPAVYAINGTIYSPEQVVELYVEVLEKFKREHPTFINSKFIFAPPRAATDEQFDKDLGILNELRLKFGNFVVGFDLVGQEDAGRPLKDFAHKLLRLPQDIKFFFHAGETNWNGMATDENLVDAILIGTKRIGHGFAITKNPKILEAIKTENICIEVNPVSNQVLKLVDDFRNHPAALLFADNYPVVISSDDPSFWRTTPLSHDFYIAFIGISSAHSDLRFLEKLVKNSIEYSSLSANERQNAESKWRAEWEKWLKWVIDNYET